MTTTGIRFDNREIFRPGTYSRQTIIEPTRGSGTSINRVVILGTSNSGVPYSANKESAFSRLNRIDSVPHAMDVTGGGVAYYLAENFLTPTSNPVYGRPASVFFVRVNPATQSMVNIGRFTIRSANYGLIGNTASIKFSEIITRENLSLSVNYYGSTIYSKSISDSLFNIDMSLTETDATGSIAIVEDGGKTKVTITRLTESMEFSSDLYPTIYDLRNGITEKFPDITMSLYKDGTYKTRDIDLLDSQIPLTQTTDSAILYGNYISAINGILDTEIFQVSEISNAAQPAESIISDKTFNLTGGTNPTPTNADWKGVLAFLETQEINHIIVGTSDPSVQTMVIEHITRMSDVTNKKERTASGGASLANSDNLVELTKDRRELASELYSYFSESFIRRDVFNDNEARKFDPFYGAAITAGLKYGNGLTFSPSLSDISILGLVKERNNTEIDDRIKAGLSIFATRGDVYEVAIEQTTTDSTKLLYTLPAAVRTRQFIATDMRNELLNKLQSMREASDQGQIQYLYNFGYQKLLAERYRDNLKLLIASPSGEDPGFWNYDLTLSGNAFKVTFTGRINLTLDYGFIDATFTITGEGGGF